MKKTVFSLVFGILIALMLCGTVFGAEILSLECNKNGVMFPGGNDRVDEVYNFKIIATGDTEKVIMNTGKAEMVVTTNPFGNQGKDTPVGMESGNYVSATVGKRVFTFKAVGYDGSVTPYDKEVIIHCYDKTGEPKTVHSVEVERDVVKEVVSAHDTIEKVELTICTSIDVRELRLVTETGNTIDEISQHCKERGSCDIVDGKKYWKVYFVSTILGKRSMSFQAMDNGVPVGDIKTVNYTVLSDEEWDMQYQPGGSAGTGYKPGTDEGFSSGDDKNATGNEDGVENGGNGQSDTETDYGSEEKGENTENSKPDGETVNKPEQQEQPKEPQKEQEKPKEEQKPVVNNNTGTGNSGFGNCCKHEDFISFIVPVTTKAIVIEFPDGRKFSVADQEKKNLATSEVSQDGKRIFWDVWIGSEFEYDDLDVTVYGQNYEKRLDYSVFQTNPFTEEEIKKYEPAIQNEIRIEVEPNQRIIVLKIGNEFMMVDGNPHEVDPGRGTKPLIIDGRTMLPIRAIVEALGGKISWEQTNRQVGVEIFNKDIKFYIDSYDMTWNGIPDKTDVPPRIINERTMLPIRFVTEVLDHTEITWNEKEQTVTIIYNY